MYLKRLIVGAGIGACAVLWLARRMRWKRHVRRLELIEQKRKRKPPTEATVTITAERLDSLKDLEVTVECRSESQLELGMNDGRPVAFFTLQRLAGFEAIAIGTRPGDKMLTGSESTRAKETRFTLNRGDFVPRGGQGEDLLRNSDPSKVTLRLYVWLDGEWRMYQTRLKPSAEDEPCVSSRPIHSFLALDHLYEKQRGARADGLLSWLTR